MPAGIEGVQQLPLAQGQQAQHAVVHGQFTLALEFAQQAAAIAACGLQRTAGNGAGQCGRTQGQATDHQVHTGPGRRACSNPATNPHTQLLEGLGVEQVIAPTSVEQRQITGRRIAGTKAIQFEHGFNAALLTLADRFTQLLDGLLFGGFFADYAATARGAVDQ